MKPIPKTSARAARHRCSAAVLALLLSAPLLGAASPAARSADRPAAEEPQLVVTVAPDAHVSFAREAVSSFHDPDLKLGIVLKTLGTGKDSGTSGTLSNPMDPARHTSGFGHRTSPITGHRGEFHTGQDFGAPCGTPVTAAAGGTVTFSGWHPRGGGNRVEVTHPGGLVTTYNHLESSAVKTGQRLKRGEILAATGTTGASTGCHLHFEVVLHGRHKDPLAWL